MDQDSKGKGTNSSRLAPNRQPRTGMVIALAATLAWSGSSATFSAPTGGLKKLIQPGRDQAERPQIRDKWALVVGCNRFTDSSVPPLKFASKNAVDVARMLKDPGIGRFAGDHVKVVNGPEATKQALETALDGWLYKKALPGDLVLIYICTRLAPAKDTGDPLLVSADTNPADAATGIDLFGLLKTIKQRVQSEYIVCMLDTSPCADSKTTPKDRNLDWLAKSGVTILSASELFQQSYDNQSVLRSRFANHFIEGMKFYGGNLPFFALAEGIWQNIKQEDEQDPSSQKQNARLVLPSPNSPAAAVVLGLVPKVAAQQVAIGHPVDRLAMTRPDIVMPKAAPAGPSQNQATASGRPPSARTMAKPPAKAVTNDDEDEGIDTNLDFGPYMTKMKGDIQKKWKPPKGLESRRVSVVFSIARDGTIVNPEIVKGSGVETVDASAMEALKAASPLDPLPKGAPKSVDISYTFDWRASAGPAH